ncbi:hypothetical protein IAR50_001147 [Cryptococcus sp. DSM 104548]
MGCRGLIRYILRNGERKAMYNHWDSYLEGQGHWIAEFISRLSPEQWKLRHLVDDGEFDGAEWTYWIDFHRRKMGVWGGPYLVNELNLDMLRENPDYMINHDWEKGLYGDDA